MVTLHEVITFLVSMQISISSLQTHNVNRCGRSRHLARKLSLRRKRSSPNVFEMAATETITSIILIKLIRVSLGTVRHPRRFKIVVIDIQITLKQMLRDFIGIRVNRAKKSGMVNITSSVNSRERSGINTILHELNPLFTITVTTRDIKSKNVYSRVNSKATTQWRKTMSANPIPPLFPYTTLFRSGFGRILPGGWARLCVVLAVPRADRAARRGAGRARQRSEEHTSELQSRRDLVCRLLLEKKKTTQWRKTESANGVHLEGVASDNR